MESDRSLTKQGLMPLLGTILLFQPMRRFSHKKFHIFRKIFYNIDPNPFFYWKKEPNFNELLKTVKFA